MIKIQSIEHNSLRHISEIIQSLKGCNPSHQTIRNKIETIYPLLESMKIKNIKFSGNYGYDEEFIKIKHKKHYILALIDVDYRILIDFKIVRHLKKNHVKNFIETTLKQHRKISITTDGKPMYKDIAKELGLKHNLCIFHLMKSFSKIFNDEIDKLKLDNYEEIRILDHGLVIKELLYTKHYERAVKLLKYLSKYTKEMPESFNKFLNKLRKNFDPYMAHLKDKKLASTNNAMENFFGVTFPSQLKNKYKTVKGVEIFLTLHIKRWNDRVINEAVKFGQMCLFIKKFNKI
jgi:transposase-like protein